MPKSLTRNTKEYRQAKQSYQQAYLLFLIDADNPRPDYEKYGIWSIDAAVIRDNCQNELKREKF